MSKTAKRIAKNTAVVFIGNNMLKILSMLLTFFIARYLGDTEYGKFSFILSFVNLFFILMDLGTRILVMRDIAKSKDEAGKIFFNIMVLKSVISTAVILIIMAASLFLGYSREIILGILIASVGLLFESLSVTLNSIFQAYEKMEYPTAAKIGRVLLRFGLSLPALLAGNGFLLLLGIYSAVQGLNFFSLFFICRKNLLSFTKDLDIDMMRDLVKRAFPFLLSGLFVSVYFRIDMTLMSKLAPLNLSGVYDVMSRDTVIGWYSAAYNILDGLGSIPTAVSAAVLPVAVKLFTKSKEKLALLANMSLKYLMAISIPAAFGICLLSREIIMLVYGYEYMNSALALNILVWTIIPMSMNYILGALMIASHSEKIGLRILFMTSLLNIGLNVLLIPKLSLIGAAIATLASEVFYFSGYGYIIIKRVEDITLFKNMVKPIIASIFMSAVIFFIPDIHVLLKVGIGLISYSAVIWMIGGIGLSDISLVKKLLLDKN